MNQQDFSDWWMSLPENVRNREAQKMVEYVLVMSLDDGVTLFEIRGRIKELYDSVTPS